MNLRRVGFLVLFVSLISLAGDFEEREIENSFGQKKGDPRGIKVSVLDYSEAKKIFDEFARDGKIPYKYPIDGCYARATAMTKIAETKNIEMGKVFIEGHLQVKTSSKKYPIVNWAWHVAPVTYVKQPNGEVRIMVFDPSLFRSPVTLEEWKKKMLFKYDDYNPVIKNIYYGSRYQYWKKSDESGKATWWKEDLDNMKSTFTKYSKLQDFSMGTSLGKPKTNSKPRGAVK
ncbi:MAG: hypothetical protein IPJ71_07580 [Bdellovibrionales bacterium]|nr:hypothetical protein [Bdellovibrionales bacterium]